MAAIKLNGKSIKAPKKRISNPLLLDEKYTGEEPSFINVVFIDETDRKLQLMKALSYYNYFYNGKTFRKDVTKYAKTKLEFDEAKMAQMEAAPDWACLLQSGALLRMSSRGFVLRDSEYAKINNSIESMVKYGAEAIEANSIAASKVITNPYAAKVISIQDRIKNKTSETILGDLDALVDEWICGASPEIDVYEAMKMALLPAQSSKYVIEWAQRPLDEMLGAINNTDEQLVEGYSHLTAKRKKQYITWYEGIIADAKRFGTNTKTARKARTKKPVSLEKQLSKLKYLKESPEHKLVSINPSLIIGATELWTYNIKYKTLTRYIADSGLGFEIKGTSLLKFAAYPVSSTRKLRKPEDTLSEVLSSSKTKGPKVFDALTTKSSAPNGRFGEDTILIKVNK